MTPGSIVPAAALLLLTSCAAQSATADRIPAELEPLVARILAAEDARGRGGEGLTPLMEGIRADHPGIRAVAVRALGRLEQDSLGAAIEPLLLDSVAGVRAEAANALGQARRGGDAGATRSLLVARLAEEPEPYVRGVIAQTLGRLPHESADAAAATATILAHADAGDADSAVVALARGFYHLARQPAARGALPPEAVGRMRLLARHGFGSRDLSARRVRTLGAAALFAARAADAADASRLLDDDQPLVRREAAAGLALLDAGADVQPLVLRVLADTAATVQIEALRSVARIGPPATACEMAMIGLRDDDPHVLLLALDILGSVCDAGAAVATLDAIAASLGDDPERWHAPAHALASLAALDAEAAKNRLQPFVVHASPFVRGWAARAAATAGDTATLVALAGDPHPNVRNEAVTGLDAAGAAHPDLLAGQLVQHDGQLLITVSEALAGTSDAALLPALFGALDRVSAERMETSRDPRTALLQRIDELGGPEHADRLRPYVNDFDSVVATQAAEIVARWTGEPVRAEPRPLERHPPPTPARLDSLARLAVVLVMDGGEVEIRLRPWLAPTNALRFARLASAGYYDGLTFHRVVPNFVVQGGSPAANEYAGDGPYTRDELGIDGNWRGTVGLSTRGRDTGDAQLYINLVDNIRLDHDYTVFGEVVRGMEVVDALLEGAVIREAHVR